MKKREVKAGSQMAKKMQHLQRGNVLFQTIVGLLITAVVLAAGIGGMRWVEEAKIKNELAELGELRMSTIDLGTKLGGAFTGQTTFTLIDHGFFPPDRVSGTGTGRVVSNRWKGEVTAAVASVAGGTNNALAYTYTGYTTGGCKGVMLVAEKVAQRIQVGTTEVKAVGAAVDFAAASTACEAAADNATLVYTMSR